jgi:uncharacterized protein YndB with AHSA1/START domain
LPVQAAFDAWTDPEIRRAVLAHGRCKADVKHAEVAEGGCERYEDRGKNRLYSRVSRRYLVIRPARLIVAQTEMSLETDVADQHFALQELLLFKPDGDGCVIVASDQCLALEPAYVHAAEDGLNGIFDAFSVLV